MDETKKLLQEMTERYEEMFAQFAAIRKVFKSQPNAVSLMGQYAQTLEADRDTVHADFALVFDRIHHWQAGNPASQLIDAIPRIHP